MRTNHRLAQLWLDALATELGASAGTIDTYTDDLNCYLVWLDENSFCLNAIRLEQIWRPSPFLLRRIGRCNDPRDIFDHRFRNFGHGQPIISCATPFPSSSKPEAWIT
jgi:hypothetical protein